MPGWTLNKILAEIIAEKLIKCYLFGMKINLISISLFISSHMYHGYHTVLRVLIYDR